MIAYATQVPTEPDDHSKAHKYPFQCAEILANCNQVLQAIADGGNDRSQASDEVSLISC